MLLKSKKKDITKLLNPSNVLTKKEERYCYSKDACNISQNANIPDSVVFVETIEDVQQVMKYAYEHEIPVISRGAGTNMVGACVCNKPGIVLNFSKMNKILEINHSNHTATVQPGVILGDLKKEAEKFDLFYPPDPSNYKVSTIGGSIAQSSGGAKALKYGTTKDYVLSLKVVTSNGNLMTLGFNTTKESMGYHLSQLIVGSEGTLAIVVEATLKLIPKPDNKTAILSYFNSEEDLESATIKILSSKLTPSAMDFMDKNSIQTVEEFATCGLNTNYNYLLLIELDSYGKMNNSQIETLEKILLSSNAKNTQIARTVEESENLWNARRVSYAAATRLAPDVVSDDIIVQRNNIASLIKKINLIIKKYSLKMCLVGHIGDGNLHPQIVLDLRDEIQYRNYMQAKNEIYTEVLNLGGIMSAEHGIGLEKKEYLKYSIDKNSLEYMKMIKQVFDPKNILNPGKIFDL